MILQIKYVAMYLKKWEITVNVALGINNMRFGACIQSRSKFPSWPAFLLIAYPFHNPLVGGEEIAGLQFILNVFN